MVGANVVVRELEVVSEGAKVARDIVMLDLKPSIGSWIERAA